MIPGPANVLCCPFCGSRKEVMSLLSGNTFPATVWSDTRREYPMLPEVSPIQRCNDCGKYYFIDQAKSELDKKKESFELGNLSYLQLKDARKQMDGLTLTKMQRWVLNHQILMAYNDCFRRNIERVSFAPSEEDEKIFFETVNTLLEGIERGEDYDLFHAELLREVGRFREAFFILDKHKKEEDQWIVDAMIKKIAEKDTMPFLLINKGEQVV